MTTYENQENARSFSPAAQSVQRSSEGMSIAPPSFSLTSNSAIQRMGGEEEEPIQAKADIQRMDGGEEEEPIQAKTDIQRMGGEEEELQAKPDDIQRQTPMEEEEKKLG